MTTRLLAGMLMAAMMSLTQAVVAQSTFPSRPITLVIPFPPGGSVDTAGRIVATELAARLGQPVVVENRSGAAGSVGSEYVARSAPDGHTLVWGTVSSHAINMAMYSSIRYDNLRDFAPITQLMEQPLLVVVPTGSPINTFAQLLAAAKAPGSKLSYGTPGVGTTGHLTGELLKRAIGLEAQHISYKGSNPMLTDLVGSQIDFGIDNLPSALAMVRGGRLKALAITSSERSPLAPDIPTLKEASPEGLVVVAWQGLFAAAGTPEPVLNRLETEVRAILARPDLREKFLKMGTTPVGSPRAEFAAFVRAETKRWGDVVRGAGLKAD